MTVFPRQGHYALDAAAIARYPPPDRTVEHIGDMNNLDISRWLDVADAGRGPPMTEDAP